MIKRIIIFGLVLVLMFSTQQIFIKHSTGAFIDTVYVDDDYNESTEGWGVDHFCTIQEGIDHTTIEQRGTIYVYEGRYNETLRLWRPTLSLIGEDKEKVIIDGFNGDQATIFDIQGGTSYIIQGFTIQNARDWGIGLTRSASNCLITDNIIQNCDEAQIYIDSSSDNIIRNNIIRTDIGIWMFSNSHRNIIEKNVITESGTGLFINNAITETIVKENIFENNDNGINIYGENSNGNLFYHNNFKDNFPHAYDYLTNTWYYSSEQFSGGNYWDDYPHDEIDEEPDGYWDIGYSIGPGDNTDEYPAVAPYSFLLELDSPSSVEEHEIFTITVSSDGFPMSDITVTLSTEPNIISSIQTTNQQGIVTFTAPDVSENTPYIISASKEGYDSINAEITILDTPLLELEELTLVSPSNVDEEESFQITVSSDSTAISDVSISFNENIYFTDTQGIAPLIAPEVEEDIIYLITASKTD